MKVIRQCDYRDCGVTCLEYIIQFYHGYVPIDKLREDTFTNQNGCTAYHLVETLKKYGFDSYGQNVSWDDLSGVIKPCIIHLVLNNGMHHFAVLCKTNKNEVLLMDPACGKKKMRKDDFLQVWNGVVLIAVPYCKIPKVPKEKSVLVHITQFMKKEKWLVISILLFSLFTSFLTIINSFYLKIGLEKIHGLSKSGLWFFIGAFGVLLFFKFLFEFIKSYLKTCLEKNIDIEYMFSFLSRLMKLPLQKFQKYHEGEILTRVNEAAEIKDLFQDICITFLFEGILGIVSFLLLFRMNYRLSLLVIMGMFLYFLIGFVTSKIFYFSILKQMDVERRWNESLVEKVRIFLTMKHLNQTEYQLDQLEEDLCVTCNEKRKFTKKALFYQNFKTNYLDFLFFLVATYGMILIGNNKLSIIDFITFQSLYFYFITPIKEITDIGPKFYYMKGILSKISETMNWEEEQVSEIVPVVPISRIDVKNLTASYNGIQIIFEKINFEIKAREHIFLDGPSGCGKSTFCQILHRDLDDYEGSIKISSKNLRDYSLSEIRSSILYLSQNETLITGSIKENILFGSSDSQRFLEVVRICEIESIVSKKSLRYETVIHESSVSGGEKQRIMLARCLMKESSVYIFDEVLSEVEKNLEKKIIKNLRDFLKDKIMIYISHTNHEKLFERRISFERTKYLE